MLPWVPLIATLVHSAAPVPAAAPPGRALVVCIENNNRVRWLDRFFEAIGALDMGAFASRYDASAILRDCRYRDLVEALDRFRAMRTDIAILAHGTKHGFILHDGLVRRSQIAALGRHSRNLRAVFQLNCWGRFLNETWLRAGARAVVGTRAINVQVVAYNEFFRAWTAGRSFRDAVSAANRAAGPLGGLLRVAEHVAREALRIRADSTFVMAGSGDLRF